jgi:hypothetical protein
MTKAKKKPFPIRLSDDEIAFLKEKASTNNDSVSGYIRKLILTDTPIKTNTFEAKTLKALSLCAGFAQVFVGSKFSEEEFKKFEETTKRIMATNGVE